jgi:hypothetical protein
VKAFGKFQAEAVEQGGLSGFGAHHAANAQLTARLTGSSASGKTTSVLWMRPNSWRMVRGLWPKPARACHCSRVFHRT